MADSASDGRRTAARPSEQNNGHRSSLRATLEVEISKDGRAAGTLTIPELRPYQRCVFGRGPDADVKLQHASLSRAHAELAVDRDGVVTLCDLGSGVPFVHAFAAFSMARLDALCSVSDAVSCCCTCRPHTIPASNLCTGAQCTV